MKSRSLLLSQALKGGLRSVPSPLPSILRVEWSPAARVGNSRCQSEGRRRQQAGPGRVAGGQRQRGAALSRECGGPQSSKAEPPFSMESTGAGRGGQRSRCCEVRVGRRRQQRKRAGELDLSSPTNRLQLDD